MKQLLNGNIRIEGKNGDVYYIDQVEDSNYKNGYTFRVKSVKGIDTYGNGYGLPTIEKAIAYVKYSIKNSD